MFNHINSSFMPSDPGGDNKDGSKPSNDSKARSRLLLMAIVAVILGIIYAYGTTICVQYSLDYLLSLYGNFPPVSFLLAFCFSFGVTILTGPKNMGIWGFIIIVWTLKNLLAMES